LNQIEILLTFRFSDQKAALTDMLKLQIKPTSGKSQFYMQMIAGVIAYSIKRPVSLHICCLEGIINPHWQHTGRLLAISTRDQRM